MKTVILVLNILIGCVSAYVIWSSNQLVKEVHDMCALAEVGVVPRLRDVQFMSVLILLSIWALSATFTEYVMKKDVKKE